jgi:hypothetical protein
MSTSELLNGTNDTSGDVELASSQASEQRPEGNDGEQIGDTAAAEPRSSAPGRDHKPPRRESGSARDDKPSNDTTPRMGTPALRAQSGNVRNEQRSQGEDEPLLSTNAESSSESAPYSKEEKNFLGILEKSRLSRLAYLGCEKDFKYTAFSPKKEFSGTEHDAIYKLSMASRASPITYSLVFFSQWWGYYFTIVNTLLVIYKSVKASYYDAGAKAWDCISLVFFISNNQARLSYTNSGNFWEEPEDLAWSLLGHLICIGLHIYYIEFQSFVLLIDIVINSVGLTLAILSLLTTLIQGVTLYHLKIQITHEKAREKQRERNNKGKDKDV